MCSFETPQLNVPMCFFFLFFTIAVISNFLTNNGVRFWLFEQKSLHAKE